MQRIFQWALALILVASTTGCAFTTDLLLNTLFGEDDAYYTFGPDGYEGTSSAANDAYVRSQINYASSASTSNERLRHEALDRGEEAQEWASKQHYSDPTPIFE